MAWIGAVVDAVHAAGTEAGRVGRIHHAVGIELVGEVQPLRMAVAADGGVQIRARRAHERLVAGARRAAGRSAGQHARGIPGQLLVGRRITVVALQGVVVLVEADAAGQRPLRAHVPGDLAEHGGVAIDTLLVGEPDGVVGDAGDRQRLRQALRVVGVGIAAGARDHVVLEDVMHLALREQAEGALDRFLLRRVDAQLVAPLVVVVALDDKLLGLGRGAAAVRAAADPSLSLCVYIYIAVNTGGRSAGRRWSVCVCVCVCV